MPEIQGKIFCYLPIADKEYSGRFPVHVHGAFSLDDSRTSLTGRREDAHKDDKQARRAEWNELLLGQAVAPAYAAALRSVAASVTRKDLKQRLAPLLFRLFPRDPGTLQEPLKKLAEAAFYEIADSRIFLDAQMEWRATDEMVAVPEDEHLERCLSYEKFSFPCPRIPSPIRSVFKKLDLLPPKLTAQRIKTHFFCVEPLECCIKEHPFQGLRSEQSLLAVIRFLLSENDKDWAGLPLAWAMDGKVRTFSKAKPLMIVSDRVARILAQVLDQLASHPLANEVSHAHPLPTGLISPKATEWLPVVAERIKPDRSGTKPKLNQDDNLIPHAVWLLDVLTELNELAEGSRPACQIIDAVPLIPDSGGYLHFPGTAATPLLLEPAEQEAGKLLQCVGVDYFVLSKSDPLAQALRSFCRTYSRVWKLEAPDLIDSLHLKRDSLFNTRTQWAKRSVVKPLLDFIEKGWESAKLDQDKDRISKLGELPLYEDQHSKFDPISESCFLEGNFAPPKSMGSLRLLWTKAFPKMMAALKVREISRLSFLEERVLPNYDDQTPETQQDWLRWIRDEWNQLLEECRRAEKDLVEIVSEADLVRTSSGEMHEATSCYHPENRRLVESVLGEVAHFPDMKFYADDATLWKNFFKLAGMRSAPSSHDMACRISGLADQVKTRELEKDSRQALITSGKYLFENWAKLGDGDVELRNGSSKTLGEYLKDLIWLPAAAGDELSRFVVKTEPERRLYKAKELMPFQLGHLVASICALLPSDFPAPSKEVQDGLGIVYRPEWQQVASHFENLLSEVGTGPFDTQKLEQLKQPLQSIYRYFGESPQQILGSRQASVSGNPLAQRFKERPCIFVSKESHFFLPGDVYHTLPKRLQPLKHYLRFDDVTADKGLELLGRKNQPGVADLAESLVRLQVEQDQPLATERIDAVNRTLALIGEMILDQSEEMVSLPRIAVLNAEGFLTNTHTAVENNDPALADALHLNDGLLLHRDTPTTITRLWRIARLKDATTVRQSSADAQSPGFVIECRKVEGLVKSKEFESGLQRIAYHHGRQLSREHRDGLSSIRIEPCSDLKCQYTIDLDHELRDLGKGAAALCWQIGDNTPWILIFDERYEDVLHERLADALCRKLGDTAPEDQTPLISILRCSPEKISGILDKLGIRSLPSRDSSEEESPISEDDTFFAEPFEDCGSDTMDNVHSDNTAEVEVSDSFPQGEHLEEDPDDTDQNGNEAFHEDDDEAFNQDFPAGTGDNGLRRRSNIPSNAGTGPFGAGSSGPRGRMLPGSPKQVGSRPNRPGSSRQQDAVWISRPAAPTKADDFEGGQVAREKQAHEERISQLVDRAAMGSVMQYERSQGRTPRRMAHANPGYDIESLWDGAVERFIEVKGIDSEWGRNGVALSPIQFAMAKTKGEQFWLYVVENARDAEIAEVRMIQNPVEKITHHQFDHGWRLAGETARINKLPQPKAGMILVVHDDDGESKEGKIVDVSENGSQLELRVNFAQGTPSRTEIFDRSCMSLRD
jgi:Domain of unknown function (DUF3883)